MLISVPGGSCRLVGREVLIDGSLVVKLGEEELVCPIILNAFCRVLRDRVFFVRCFVGVEIGWVAVCNSLACTNIANASRNSLFA